MLFIKLLHRTIAQIIVASPKWKFNASFVVHSLSRAGRWNLQFTVYILKDWVSSLFTAGLCIVHEYRQRYDWRWDTFIWPHFRSKTASEPWTQLSFQKEQSTWKNHAWHVHKNATSLANQEWGDVLYSCMHNIIFLNKSEPQLLKPGGLEPSFKAGIKSN